MVTKVAMARIIDRISGLDTGKYRVEETKDDQRQRQEPESQYNPSKEKDQFDKKGAAKKLLLDSRQTLRTGTFRNRDEISLKRIEVSEISRVERKPHWSHPYLMTLGIMTPRRKVRLSVAFVYGVLVGMILTVSLFILRLFFF